MSKGLEVLATGKKRTKITATIDGGNALLSKQEVEVIEKELKALEIVFSKQVDIALIYECNSYDDYCDRNAALCPKFEFECDKDEWFDSFMLTEDEWDLLRRLA